MSQGEARSPNRAPSNVTKFRQDRRDQVCGLLKSIGLLGLLCALVYCIWNYHEQLSWANLRQMAGYFSNAWAAGEEGFAGYTFEAGTDSVYEEFGSGLAVMGSDTLSFINACYSLCKKGIKKKMLYQEENFNAKIRGKIDVKKNIRMNTSHGRNERFYCKYIDFTADNTENRILKAALTRCRKIVEQKFELHVESVRRMYYCLNTFRGVKNVQIKNKDFNSVSVTGLYTYYKPLLRQAKSILGQKYHSVKGEDGRQITKSIYTIPCF